MSTHTGRAFLNSCLRVPIDPCNNCPAPIYNRPKMYFGRSTTKAKTKSATGTPSSNQENDINTKTPENETEIICTSAEVRSLAKLYDSIPDYCDINHLPEYEFYSTLNSLRSTCRELKVNSQNSDHLIAESHTSCPSPLYSGKADHTKKQKKKKSAKKFAENKSKYLSTDSKTETNYRNATPCSVELTQNIKDMCRLRSLKDVCEYDIKAFRRTLKEFEEELDRPISTAQSPTKRVNCIKTEKHKELKIPPTDKSSASEKKDTVPVKPTTTSTLRETLRKSFSFNDLDLINDLKNFKDVQTSKLTKADISSINQRSHLSKYFMPKKSESTEPSNTDLPKINIESPSSGTVSSKISNTASSISNFRRRKKTRSKKTSKDSQLPFTLFDLSVKKDTNEPLSASPVHPVARPNLAATLRAEVCKKKLKELQNNCTYHDTTPQFDWEVRKTPAWKSLSLNESHKTILEIRLATRKAEQALELKEYELNMELMRQRVKSAPLLLEGPTFWGPNVGKLTHNCQKQSIRHACNVNQRKQRRKTADRSCSTNNSLRCQSNCNCNDIKNRFEVIQKIYASSEKSLSRNSTRLDMKIKHVKDNDKSAKSEATLRPKDNYDSIEELSTFDRALL